MLAMKSNITNNDVLYPDEISKAFSYFLCDTYDSARKLDNEMIDGIEHLQAICENPFNNEYFRVLYDVLSSIAVKLEQNDYYQ